MMRTAVSLFAGSGAATEPFRRAGWRVVRVDLEAVGPGANYVRADVRRLPLRGPVDFLWASPPCTEFSDADARVDHKAKAPSLDLVWATMAAVRDLRPRYWVLENVRGAIPFLGIPAAKIGPFCLWGYFPPLEVTLAAQVFRKWTAGRSAAARARIPAELAQGVFEAVDRGWALKSVLDMRPFRRHRHVAARRRDGSQLEL